MFKRLLFWILGYAWLLLLIGLGLLGMAGYAVFSASQGGKIPPEAALTVQSGHIVAGRTVTVERKRRRSGSTSTRRYYELDLQPPGAALVKLRVDYAVPRRTLEVALEEDVTVKYDPDDSNATYVIQLDGQDVLPYAQMARLSQQRADADKASHASWGSIGTGLVLALLGAGGVAWRRKLLADDDAQAEQQADEQPPQPPAGGSMIGSGIPPGDTRLSSSGERK
ncbi:MAG: hypothetical protein Q4G71_15800 [Pseudomonadota bacterium]|nr:hypothetical protein [Pseudomonadota bacterium]